MISFLKIMRQVLCETMSFRNLLQVSDPARVDRSTHVNSKSLRVASIDENEAWTFSYKSQGGHSTTGMRHQGYVRFLKENVAANENAEDLECMVDCTCFAAGTMVLMEDGHYHKIEDIQIGDMVYTHKGRPKRVVNKISKKVNVDDPTYKIKVCGFPIDMIVTGDHPFYTLRGNDYCICGCNTPIWESSYSHKCSSPDLILSKKYVKGHYRGIRGVAKHDNCCGIFEWVPVKNLRLHEWFLSPWIETNVVECDADFARLVGYYIAEGCIPSPRGSTVRLTFNINEWNTLGKDVISICNNLGYKASLFKSNHGNWFDVRINDLSFKEFCINNIGNGSHKKKISSNIMQWNNNALKNVFVGAILGDGWLDPEKGMKYVSVNFNLISQISTILNKLHVRNNICIANNSNLHVKHTMFQVLIPRGQDGEQVRNWLYPYLREKDKFVSSQEDLRSKHHSREEGCLKSMKSCEKIQYDGLVYDITVEDDESFIAHGVAVHNCPDYRYRWAYNNAKAGAGITGAQSWSGNNGQPPRPREQGGVGDLGEGLCKHLISLGRFLKTGTSDAPQPDDIVPQEPSIKQKPFIKKPTASKPSMPTSNAPSPEDTYSDSRTDLDENKVFGIREIFGNFKNKMSMPAKDNSTLYERMKKFVKENPEFEVPYE